MSGSRPTLPATDPSSDLDSVVIFRLGGEAFALAVDVVREIVPISWLAAIPRMPSFVQGILNLGGVAIPVLRLDRLFGLGQGIDFGLESSILVTRGSSPMGVLVERVEDVRRVTSFETLDVEASRSFNGCVSAQLVPIGKTGEPLSLVSWDKVLLVEERERVAEFQAQSQARLAELSEAAS